MTEHLQRGRKAEFGRNPNLEAYLKNLSEILWPAERRVLDKFIEPRFPLIFVVGAPRSGTTLLLQWLSFSECFSYPSNFISRFYNAPYIGAKIQQMITDPELSFRKEMDGPWLEFDLNFRSSLGKTDGLLSPNEFWYFWRRFFPYSEVQYLDEKSLEKISVNTLKKELAAFESVLKKPLVMKGMMFNWNIPFLASIMPGTIFIYIEREPLYNIQSLLQAREAYFGDRNRWYSFKPPEYKCLSQLDPIEQTAGQVYYTNMAIQKGLGRVPKSKQLHIRYETFCRNPREVWKTLSEKLKQSGYALKIHYDGPESFDSTNILKIDKKNQERISSFNNEIAKINGSSDEIA